MKKLLMMSLLTILGSSCGAFNYVGEMKGTVISKSIRGDGFTCFSLSSGNNREVNNIRVCNTGDYTIPVGSKVKIKYRKGITVFSHKIDEVFYYDN